MLANWRPGSVQPCGKKGRSRNTKVWEENIETYGFSPPLQCQAQTWPEKAHFRSCVCTTNSGFVVGLPGFEPESTKHAYLLEVCEK
jgi:hypothetical protein